MPLNVVFVMERKLNNSVVCNTGRFGSLAPARTAADDLSVRSTRLWLPDEAAGKRLAAALHCLLAHS
jgi:hypothetical protein